MATTIQVSRKTKQLLDVMKRRWSAKSYDEVLRRLIAEKMGMPASLFGSNPRLSPFEESEEAEFHEL